jgi:shikimate dehydrogenase
MKTQAEAEDDAIASAPHPALRAGLLGRGIQESRSPRMHKAEGARLGLSYDYRLFDFDTLRLADSELGRVVQDARLEGYAGLNVTHPFKERVIPFLDDLSPEAAAIGAVNTIVFRDGEAVGHNTDCWGFAESFRRGLEAPGLGQVVLIGAGGAGMAVAKALLDLGVSRLAIVDTERTKAARLIESLRDYEGTQSVAEAAGLGAALAGADGLVNATPMGMAKYPGMPVERSWLRPDLWVADIVYFPADTELLKAARAVGCQTLPGAGMAIFQAVKAFELITGVGPDPNQMAHHFQAE